MTGYGSHLPTWKCGEKGNRILYSLEINPEKRASGDSPDASRTAFTVSVADEMVGIVNVAAIYAQGFQRPRDEADVREILRCIEEHFHGFS